MAWTDPDPEDAYERAQELALDACREGDRPWPVQSRPRARPRLMGPSAAIQVRTCIGCRYRTIKGMCSWVSGYVDPWETPCDQYRPRA